MLLQDIIVKILNKSSLPNQNDFFNLAYNDFVFSISKLIKSGNYSEQDIIPLINNENLALNFNQNSIDVILAFDIFKILNVSCRNHFISIIDYVKFNQIQDIIFTDKEIFVSLDQNILKFYNCSDLPAPVKNINVKYIWLPNINSWTNNQDLSLFSTFFLSDCIDFTIEKIKKQMEA